MAHPYRIPLIRPVITERTRQAVLAVLDGGMLTEGPVTRAFEAAVRDHIGCRHVIAVTSCTVGLEMALRALSIGAGDEVILPDYTYPATADAVVIAGAVPVVVDVDPDTMVIDPQAVEQAVTGRTRAIMPVSAFGNPCDYDALRAIARRHGLRLIEDAAPALGASFHGIPVGRHADISVFSLHPRKFITTGEGGLLTTDDDALADWLVSYKHFGMTVADGYATPPFAGIGTNGKLSDVLAAIGLSQMEQFSALLERRLALAERYIQRLGPIPGLTVSPATVGGIHSRQSFCIHLDHRDRVMQGMRQRGIEAQIGTYALHREPGFAAMARFAGPLNGSRRAFERTLTLPLYHEMSDADQDCVVDALREEMAACAV